MNLLRRCRYRAPVAVNKANSAGVRNHLAFQDTSPRPTRQATSAKVEWSSVSERSSPQMKRLTRRRFLGTTSAALGTSLPPHSPRQSPQSAGPTQRPHTLVRKTRRPMDRRASHRQRPSRRHGLSAAAKTAPPTKSSSSSTKTPYGPVSLATATTPKPQNISRSVRAAVLEQQNYHLADQLCHKMQGLFAESYQPLGNLRLELTHPTPPQNYRRQLDLDTAIATTTYEVAGVQIPSRSLRLRSRPGPSFSASPPASPINSTPLSPSTARSRNPSHPTQQSPPTHRQSRSPHRRSRPS